MALEQLNLNQQVKGYYIGTQAAVEALTGVPEGSIGYATDINEFGSYDGSTWTWISTTGGGHVIQDEGTPLTARPNLNFIGAGVTATDNSGTNTTDVTISGGGSGHVIQDEGTPLTARANLNFIGGGVTATDNSGTGATDVTIPSGLTQEEVEDYVGAMFTGNTQTRITTTYDDATGKINVVVDAIPDTEAIQDIIGGMINTQTRITVTYDDATGKLNFVVDAFPTVPTQEDIEDYVGGMVSGNTETGIAVTYDDTGGKLNFDAQTAGDARYIQKGALGSEINGSTDIGGTVFESNDEFIAADASNSFAQRKVTGSLVKATIYDYLTGLKKIVDATTVANDFLVGDSGHYWVKKTLAETRDILADTSQWITCSETWTRTGNYTFTVSGDLTLKYRKGAKVRYKDGGSYEYGVINTSSYSSPNTTVTLITNSDYAMAAATITDTYICYIENPEGWPEWFNYTGTWSMTGGSGFAVGNASSVWRWRASGGTIFVKVRITTGNTTNFGTGGGSYNFSIPVNATNISNAVAMESAAGNLLNASTRWALASYIRTSDMRGIYGNQILGSTMTGITWAAGDEIRLSGWYEF